MEMVKNVWLAFCLFFVATFFNAQNKTKVACIGNSVTFGYGLKNPSTESYPSILQGLLGSNYEVGNFGHSGATLLQKGHKPYIKTEEYQKAMAFQPDIAIIHLGLNDTDPRNFPNFRDEFIPNYTQLIKDVKQSNPKAKVYICTLTPIFTGHSRFGTSTYDWYNALQEKIKEVAKINHVPLIDLNKHFRNRPDLITDEPTLHPNKEGAKHLGETVYKYLTGNFGGLKLADIFTDNLILQREQPIKIWGLANAATPIEVTLGNEKKATTSTFGGTWEVIFQPKSASEKPITLKVKNEKQQLIVKNILVGDVWLASGQSNMYFPLKNSIGGDDFAKKEMKNKIRWMKYKPFEETDDKEWSEETMKRANELDFFSGKWQENNPENAKDFSGIGYSFATSIQKEVGVPIGVIEMAVGGSPQISWISRTALEQDPLFYQSFKNWRNNDFIMGWARSRASKNVKNANSAFQRHSYEPAFNFEAGISKINNFPIKGVIWYQGESDAENAELYKKLFPLFIKDWRQQWHEDLPFYYVQLSGINRPSWNYFRDAQRILSQSIPNVYMAISSDLGDIKDVHPTDKIPIGKRLAKLALYHTYQKSIEISNGPLFKSAQQTQNQIIIDFDYSKGLKTSDGSSLKGFKNFNQNYELIPANAVIKGNQIIITLPANTTVKSVVYAWEPFPGANLVNEANLPASTFKYDFN